MKLKTIAIIVVIVLLLILVMQYTRIVDLPKFILLPLGVLLGFLAGYVVGRVHKKRK